MKNFDFLSLLFSLTLAFQVEAANYNNDTVSRFIACQYSSDTSDVVDIVSISGKSVIFVPQDDDIDVRYFRGTLEQLNIEDTILLKASAPGRDAQQILTIEADTISNIITVEQVEIDDPASITYECEAIRFRF